MGKNVAHPELDEVNELETGAAMMQLEDQAIAILVAGRNAVHVETEQRHASCCRCTRKEFNVCIQ